MKKLVLAAAVAALASSATAAEGSFYVRGDVGASFLPKQKYNDVKGKRTNHVVAGLGVGTYLMDNVRTELGFSNHFNAEQKFSTAKVKAKAMSLTLKGLVDVFDYGMGKVFVGAGVGMTQLSAKAIDGAVAGKAKKKNNVSFLGTVGSSFDVSEGVMLDLAYAYNDHGKTKNFGTTKVKYHFKSHDLTAGVRVEL